MILNHLEADSDEERDLDIHAACNAGDLQVERCLEASGETPLLYAAMGRSSDVVL